MSPPILDFVGVGYGPAHISLSVSLRENLGGSLPSGKVAFLEANEQFRWHTSLLLPGAMLQVSPLKDMAMLRDPTSSFTYYNYLFKQGRLASYINRSDSVPSRREWSAYLAWCARRMKTESPDDTIRFGHRVQLVKPIDTPNGRIFGIDVLTSQGHEQILARNVSVAVGGVPSIPSQWIDAYTREQAAAAPRIIHSGRYLPGLRKAQAQINPQARIAVVGCGQSGAEISLHLHALLPGAQIETIYRRPAVVPSDDSAFVNGAAFDPESTTAFWNQALPERQVRLDEWHRTNYGVVHPHTLDALYETVYQQQVERLPVEDELLGREAETGSIRLRPSTTATPIESSAQGITLRLNNAAASSVEEVTYDLVLLATGFKRQIVHQAALAPLATDYPLATATSPLEAEPDAPREPPAGASGFSADTQRAAARGITRDYRLVTRAERDANRSAPSSPGSGSAGSALLASHATLVNDDEAGAVAPLATGGIYVLGPNEGTHGLSDSLLSVASFRAGEITESLRKYGVLARLGANSQQTRSKQAALAQAQARADDLAKPVAPALAPAPAVAL